MNTVGSRRLIAVGAVFALAIAGIGVAQQDVLNDPTRPEAERMRDAGTKPLELYAFFEVAEGATVADMMPGGGYHTAILSKLVGDSGMVYSGPGRGDALANRFADTANVEIVTDMVSMPAGSVDVIITVRNFHDLVNRGNDAAALAGWMEALKPGGILGIVDARTKSHDGFDGNTHRINEQLVIDTVTAAGFELVESSELLANPDDDDSVGSEEGTERYEIDRLTLKFRKPGM